MGDLPRFCEFYLQELYQGLPVNAGDKKSPVLLAGGRESNHFEMHSELLALLNKGLPSR